MLVDIDDLNIYEKYTTDVQLISEMALLNVKLLSDITGKHQVFHSKEIDPKHYKYAPADKKLFARPDTSYIKRLPQLIKANIGYDFIFVVNDVTAPTGDAHKDVSLIQPTQGVITVVVDPTWSASVRDEYTHNRSMPLTPHTICHKVGHAISDDVGPFAEKVTLEVVVPLLEYKLKAANMSTSLSNQQRDKFIEHINYWIDTFKEEKYQQNINGCVYAPCELGKFKTAREMIDESFGDINTYTLEPGEFFNEIVARYVLTGNIDFNPWPTQQLANTMANYIKSKINEILDKCKGRVIGQFEWRSLSQ